MNKLEELIQQYCPNGVNFRPLGEVCSSIRTGKLNANEKDEDGLYPFFTCDAEPYRINTYAFDCEAILITGNGSQVGHINYYKGKFNAYQRTYVLSSFIETVDVFFVLHYFRAYLKEYILVNSKKGSVPYITLPMLQNFLIPIPPLPVQEEIVRVLDTFTELQAELQAELQKRLQQYKYYRDNLLSFEGRTDVEWKKLGEIATEWYRGAGIKRDEVSEEGYPCIRYGEIHTTYNIWFDECVSHTDESQQPARKYADYGDILFAITSEDIPFVGNSVAYLGKERILVGGDIVVMKHTQDPKYMSYVLSTSDAVKQKGKGKVKSKVVHTNVPSLQEIVVPLPSLEEQKRIASTLDKFYSLLNDLTSGLPAEIEKRKQQYEYYRDKLLTFKRITK
jgi:type I restriction enzyme S subunit